MAKVITLSRRFPSYHKQAGHPTYFVEKVHKALGFERDETIYPKYEVMGVSLRELNHIERYYQTCDLINSLSTHTRFEPKLHTIRIGERWKDGDKASLRVWSNTPYNSPQLIIAPDIEIRVQKIELDSMRNVIINGKRFSEIDLLAKNDGLTRDELSHWFLKPFIGQIIHFTHTINY